MSQVKALSISEALINQVLYVWIDVRSEKEFERANIPGSINLPILNNADRTAVGTTYKMKGRESAVKIGLELMGPKFANYYQSLIAIITENPEKKLLFYCWRGGLRSQIASAIIQWSGHSVNFVSGGYKSFRRWVFDSLSIEKKITLISGHTGSGKTEILHFLKLKGEHILDLEGLANHKGSALGGIGMPPQPSTEMFENLIAMSLLDYRVEETIYIENESRMIGHCVIPSQIWSQMLLADSIQIIVPRDIRIERIAAEYGSLPKEELIAKTQQLKKRLGGQHEKAAIEALNRDDFETWINILLDYYDKSYTHFVEKNNQQFKSIPWDWNQNLDELFNQLKSKIYEIGQ